MILSLQRLAVEIVVSGIAYEPDDFTKPWEAPDGDSERFCNNPKQFQTYNSQFHLFLQKDLFPSIIAAFVALLSDHLHQCRYALRWESDVVFAASTAIQNTLKTS